MLSIFETVNAKWDQATTKPASKHAYATTSDPVTSADLLFDNCVTLVMTAWTLDKCGVKSKVDGLMDNVCWLCNYHLL